MNLLGCRLPRKLGEAAKVYRWIDYIEESFYASELSLELLIFYRPRMRKVTVLPVCLSVCVCVQMMTFEPFDLLV